MRQGVVDLRGLADVLRGLPPAADDSERVDRIRALEELKSVVAAAQAAETVQFVASQRSAQAAAGVPDERAERGVAAQVGLARRVSPFHASRYVGWVKILTNELPATYAALRAGQVSEWRAMLVARETAWLAREHRLVVDAELSGRLESFSDRQVEGEARKLGYALDPEGYVARLRTAESERRVSVRPAPDVMARLTAVLPVAQAVAAYAALARHADTLKGAGDPRGRGQIMADTLVERCTGQAVAGDVPVEINLIMTDQALFGNPAMAPAAGNPDEPAQLFGYGPVPAKIAQDLVFGPSEQTPRWIRRLFTCPDTGQLAAMDAKRRLFTDNQRHFIQVRDQHCRQPYCDAPIRHIDHVVPAERGGPTDVGNGQGYCEACNYSKQAPGWDAELTPIPAEFVIITPTGHRYHSRAPDPPVAGQPPRKRSPVEQRLAQILFAA